MHNSRTLLRSGSLLLATIVASGTLAITTSALPAYADTNGTATDTTVANFTDGTLGAGTYVADSSGGEVILAPDPVVSTEFDGSDLPLTWYSTQWNALGGTSTVADGQLTVDGALAHSYNTYAPSSSQSYSLEFDATLGQIAYQSAGFGLDLETDRHWILFSTDETGTKLMTSVSNGAPDPTTFEIAGSYLGAQHHYRIDWTASTIVFSIDGTALHTETEAITEPLHLSANDFAADTTTIGNGSVLKVSSMRLSPYAASGTFTSRVLDAGGAANWGAFSWLGSTPTGTGLTMKVRTGNTPTVDGTWSAFTSIANGGDVTTYGRYLQYEATATSDSAHLSTPTLASVSAAFVVDTTAPTITTRVPAANATTVAVGTPVTVTFSEPVAASSGSAVTLRAAGASVDVAATAAVSGSTVTLTPSADLALNTTYTVTVSTALADMVGNHLASAASWTFTTAQGTINAGAPTVSGTVAVGQTLTAVEGTWTPTPTFTYTWLRGTTAIPGATAKTYVVTIDDVGAKLSVDVTGSLPNYASVTAKSDPTNAVPALGMTPVNPTIDNTAPKVDDIVTAKVTGWAPDGVAFTYQWYRQSAAGAISAISGATAASYTVTSADLGAKLQVAVTGTKKGYDPATRTSDWTAATAIGAYTSSPNPTISGTPRVGTPLTAALGTWSPVPTSVTYQWYYLKSSGSLVTIKKATAATYTPTSSLKGKRLEVRIQASRAGQTTVTRYSAKSAKVGSPMTGKTPKISDTTPKAGQKLTAKPGSWKPSKITFTYQWYAKSGSTVTMIPGATGKTYTVDAAYAGARIRVQVTGSKATYKPVTKTSAYTKAVK